MVSWKDLPWFERRSHHRSHGFRGSQNLRKDYYLALERAQLGNEITPWLVYFCETALEAQRLAKNQILYTLRMAKFIDRFRERWNPRQAKVVQRMCDAGPAGFEGGMSAHKYRAITKASKATATRDLQDLVAMGVLQKSGGSHSTRYSLDL